MKPAAAKDPDRILRDEGPAIDDALRQGVRDALLHHKERGNRVVIERDGKIVWVRPEDLLAE
jgi:hypothetical protein